MGNFNRDNRSGGRPNFGRRDFGNRGEDRQMFKTTCSKCGKECEVPFKPTGSRPVYCSDCFRDIGGPDSRRTDDRGSRRPNFESRGGGLPQPQYKEQFEAISVKLDKILRLLNPEKSMEVAKVVSKPQIKKTTESVENIEPVKKKTKAKKPAPTDLPVEIPAE